MPKHPNKHIQSAIEYAMAKGWTVTKASSTAHIWGSLYCHHSERGGCIRRIYSTPRVPENHAKQIRRAVDKCPH